MGVVARARQFWNQWWSEGDFVEGELEAMSPSEMIRKIRQIEIRSRRIVTETLAGQYHSAFKGVGMDFDEVREYQAGDDVRAIDWNVTARMNHTFIKKFREERELTVMLLVDLSGSGKFGSGEQTKRELMAELASVLAFSAIRNQDKVGVVLFTEIVEKYVPPKKGRRHVLRVVRDVLCHQPVYPGTGLNGALDFAHRILGHRSVVVIISDFLGESHPNADEIAAHLRRKAVFSATLGKTSPALLRQVSRRHDLIAVQVVDPRERELPSVGRILVEDAETGQRREVNTSDERRRLGFTERQNQAQEELERLFRTSGVESFQVRTGESYGPALTRFFEKRERKRRRG